jgi:cytochrome c nitrite reductase small subunit
MSKTPFIIAVAVAVLALGYFTYVTDAPAYAGTAPETCANCHVIDAQYESWYRGAHKNWAKCTDCHLPHDNLAVFYAEKGRQGMNDAYAFISGDFPPVFRTNEKSNAIIQKNCIHCHEDTVETMLAGAQPFDRKCWDCHRNIAHGERGASFAPYQDSTLYPSK